MKNLQTLKQDLSFYKALLQRVFFAEKKISQEQLTHWLLDIKAQLPSIESGDLDLDYFPDEHKDSSLGSALMAATYVMRVEHRLASAVKSDSQYNVEQSALIVHEMLLATNCLWRGCGEIMLKYADERERQKRNQPKTRKRTETMDKDLSERWEDYKREKGKTPKNYGIFLTYLANCGGDYHIDRADETIECSYWKSHGGVRKLTTVQNWFSKKSKENR